MALHNLATDLLLQIEANKRIHRALHRANRSLPQTSIPPTYHPTNKALDLVSMKAEAAVKLIA